MEKKKLKTDKKNIIKNKFKKNENEQDFDKELLNLYMQHNEAP